MDIWHDDEGTWTSINGKTHGPFDHGEVGEQQAVGINDAARIAEHLASLVDDDNAQGDAADLNALVESFYA